MKKNHKKYARILRVLFCCSFLGALFFTYRYVSYTRTRTHELHQQAQQETHKAADDLYAMMFKVETWSQNIVNGFASGELTQANIAQHLQTKPVEIFGAGVAFANKLYAPYFFEQQDGQTLTFVQDSYDYTQDKNNWFNTALNNDRKWLEPYVGKTSNALLVEFVQPFYLPNDSDNPAGVVFTAQSVNHLKHIISTLYRDQTGYWFLLSDKGALIAHPENRYVNEQKTIFDIAQNINSDELQQAGKETLNNQSGQITYNNEITGKKSWLFYEHIPSTNWTICRVYDLSELPFNATHQRRSLFALLLSLLLTAVLIALYGISYLHSDTTKLWLGSCAVSLGLLLAIVSLWVVTKKHPEQQHQTTPIKSKASIYSFIERLKKEQTFKSKRDLSNNSEQSLDNLLTYRYKNYRYIPTGVFIKDLSFKGQERIDVVMYVWQRYFDAIHDNVERGFILPQAISVTKEELYKNKEHNEETIIWYVQATLDQKIFYTRYPFDMKNLHIQFWHADFSKDIVLVPDLDAYKIINPTALPGVGKQAYIGDWHLRNSYFGYTTDQYNTTFGLYSYGPFGIYNQIDKSGQPELHFTITAQRPLLSTIIADLLPISVIVVLLFFALLTSNLQGLGILGTCASIFFGTVYAQARFRARVPNYNVVYFENFFFVIYAALIATIIVAMLYAFKSNIWWVKYKDNLIAKILFWPLVLLSNLIITLAYLY